MSVEVRNGNVDFALKRLRTQTAKSGTLSKARERSDGYTKRGVKNRLKKEAGIKNAKKASKKNRD